MTTKLQRSIAVSIALAATSGIAFASPAHAAAANTASVTGQTVRYVSGTGQDNHVVINKLGTVVVIDDRVKIAAGSGCSYPNPEDTTLVWCDAPGATSIYVDSGAGNDYIRSFVLIRNELHGGSGNDTIYGGNRADKIWGDAGNDSLYGQRGDDKVYGGSGNDTIYGWYGSDDLWGESGNDTISGQDGDDTLHGGGGRDHLYGGSGDNTIIGGPDADTCKDGPHIRSC